MSQFRARHLGPTITSTPLYLSNVSQFGNYILLSFSKVIYNNGTAMNYKRKTILLTQWLSLQRVFLWVYPLSHSTIHLLIQQYFLGLTVSQHLYRYFGARIKSEA